jgi:hypothetical protein
MKLIRKHKLRFRLLTYLLPSAKVTSWWPKVRATYLGIAHYERYLSNSCTRYRDYPVR